VPQAAIELITRQAADATATFLTGDHLDRRLAEIEQRAGVAVRDVLATRVTSTGADRPARDARPCR